MTLCSSRLLLAPATLLLLGAATASQVPGLRPAGLPPPSVRQVEQAKLGLPSPQVTIGDGVHSTGMYTGVDQTPFEQALAALPDGGTVLVGAGTYTFSEPVVVSTSGIAIRGQAATIVSSPDPDVGVLDVQTDDVTVEGLGFREVEDHGTDHALVRVAGSRVRLVACAFDAVDASGAPRFILLAPDQKDRWIEGNRFAPAAGWTCVRAEGSRGLHLARNNVGAKTGATGMAYGFELVDEIWTEIVHNTFLGVGSEADPVEAVIAIRNDNGEGHHSVISGNIMHVVVARRAVHLAGVQFTVFSGNALGRIVGSQLLAMLDVDSGPQATGAQSLVVSGNEFHNSLQAPMLRINGIRGANVSGNQFSLAGGTVIVVGDQETAHQVTLATNAFGATPAIPPMPAVRVSGGSGHVVLGNSFDGFLLDAVEMTGVPPDGCVVDLNIEE